LSILERILSKKRAELEALRGRRWPSPPARRVVDLRRAGGPLKLITEIKRRSPSAGALSTKLGVAERARVYEAGGASMLSVLCDADFFDGSFEHLLEAKSATSLPVLCKEFVLDELQLDQARAYGADAVLIIVRCLAPERVPALISAARQRELVPFVEITSEDEMRLALEAGADLVGVNARDLDTLAMDGARAGRVLETLPDGVVRVHLSGVAQEADIVALGSSPADAVLVGEALMRLDDPGPLLSRLVAAAQPISP
jgi:indole-3-glycerol phosphate synthase